MRKILALLLCLCAAPAAAQNYQATAGAGLTFGANLVGGILYPQQNMCDPTTPARCVVVDASGRPTVNINGTVTITGALTANQSVNVSQINGVTPLMGQGATGTGSHRVTLANDNTIPTGWPTAANQASQITQETAINTFLGVQGDAVCGTATGTCTLAALVKFLNSAATSSTPAGTNAIGDVGYQPRAAKLTSAVVNFASSGDNTVITRVTGTIKVYQMYYVCASAVTQTIKNGAGTALSGAMPSVTTVNLPLQSEPYYTTTSTNNFVVNLGSAVSCQGTVWYLDN